MSSQGSSAVERYAKRKSRVSIKLSQELFFFPLTSDAADAGDQERTGEMHRQKRCRFHATQSKCGLSVVD